MEIKKSPDSNLESRKPVFFAAGLLIALAFVLMGFEYKSFERNGFVLQGDLGDLDELDVEIIPISVIKPPPPPPPPPAPPTVFDKVKDEVETPDVDFGDLDPTDIPPIVDFPDEEPIVEEPLDFAEVMPSFPGGEKVLFQYLSKHISYPSQAYEQGITGIVYVSFVVGKLGEISEVKVLKGIPGGCEEEALKVIESMPNWEPGFQGGKPVPVRYTLPIRFTIH